MLRSHYLLLLALLFCLAVLVKAGKHDDDDDNDDSGVSLEWLMEHLGSSKNYPSYKFQHTPEDPITKDYDLEQIQFIIRHGTRYPTDGDVEGIQAAVKKLNESKKKLKWLEDVHSYNIHYEGLLNTRGQMEHYLMGRRLAVRFPKFIKNLTTDGMVVPEFGAYSSWSSRTTQSGHAFTMGLYENVGKLGSANMMAVPLFTFKENNDSLIAFHKACPKWEEEAKPLVKKKTAFTVKRYLDPIASRLSGKLGLNLTSDDVLNFYSGCQSEASIYGKADTFCQLMTKKELENLEYNEDLKHYYKYSYGIPEVNADMACDLGKKIVENIESTDKVKLDLKFGHSETMLPLRTFLGLYHDKDLSENTPESEIENRQFRLSKFGFYANNIMFQVLRHKKTQKKFIRVLDNEEIIKFPGCQSEMCPVEQFMAYMKPKLTCNFQKNCDI